MSDASSYTVTDVRLSSMVSRVRNVESKDLEVHLGSSITICVVSLPHLDSLMLILNLCKMRRNITAYLKTPSLCKEKKKQNQAHFVWSQEAEGRGYTVDGN